MQACRLDGECSPRDDGWYPRIPSLPCFLAPLKVRRFVIKTSSEPTRDSRFNGGIPIECVQAKTYFKPNDKLAGLTVRGDKQGEIRLILIAALYTGFWASAAISRRFEDGLKIGVIARPCEVEETILSTGDASSLHANGVQKPLPVREG